MSQISFVFLAVALAAHFHNAAGDVLFPRSTEPTQALIAGTTLNMERDWSARGFAPVNLPARTFREMWVRMFPLLTLPLGDPYAETQNTNELYVENPAGLKLYGLDDGALLASGANLHFDFQAGEVKVDGRAFVLEPLWIVPDGDVTLLQWDKGSRLPNGKPAEVRVRVRGGVLVQETLHTPKDQPQRVLWSAINVLDVNDYLKSVVPSEVIASWRPETLKAQAIAARTYGLYEAAVGRQSGRAYDVDPSTWYQSYQGARFWNRETRTWRTVELAATTTAVNATGSKVIQHGGEIIKAFFSSNSGGRTCTLAECLETGVNLPYLREVDDAPGIQSAAGGTWGTRSTLTRIAIRDKLLSVGVTLPAAVSKLEHLERGVSGRTWRMRVKLQNGDAVDLTREQSRKIMHLFGPIRSFKYELGTVNSAGKQSIVGHGYGHGVGMSQWGAQLFARSGWSAERILKHYYTGVTVAPLSEP